MIPIKYVIGDATEPQGAGRKIIAHICNDVGAWGAGFVLALSAVDKRPEEAYRQWFKQVGQNLAALDHFPPFRLGEILFAPLYQPKAVRELGDTYFVCNMIAQQGCGPAKCLHCTNGEHQDHGACIHCNGTGFIPPLRFWALNACLVKLGVAAKAAQATVHMPRIGCGLAGGKWDKVSKCIQRELSANNVEVTIYDQPRVRNQESQPDRPYMGAAQGAMGGVEGSAA